MPLKHTLYLVNLTEGLDSEIVHLCLLRSENGKVHIGLSSNSGSYQNLLDDRFSSQGQIKKITKSLN